jgi:hypothetical protein
MGSSEGASASGAGGITSLTAVFSNPETTGTSLGPISMEN